MSDIPTVTGSVHEGMDELDFDSQPGPPSLAGPVTPRKCRRHVWVADARPIEDVLAAGANTAPKLVALMRGVLAELKAL